MAATEVSASFEQRRRENARRIRSGYANSVAAGIFFTLFAVQGMTHGWWQTPWPAAIATGFTLFTLIGATSGMMMAGRAYVSAIIEGDREGMPPLMDKFGRQIFRYSGTLDAWAEEAGCKPLSAFESPNVLLQRKGSTYPQPQWHDAGELLATVEAVLGRVRPEIALHEELSYLAAELRVAVARGSRAYLLVESVASGGNAQMYDILRGVAEPRS